MMSSKADLDRLARWLRCEWSEQQRSLFVRYERWLVEEALPAGGIGPGEQPRVFDRHIADSLAFLRIIDVSAETLIDVGTGVGLPAIPIAIALPEMDVVAIDRSERRSSLASRAVRILKLPNVRIRTCDAGVVSEMFDVVTFRASLQILPAAAVFRELAVEGGEGIFALSRRTRPDAIPDPPTGTTFSLEAEGAGVLDSPAWFLRMR